jgi:hypothetical protein
MGKFTPHRNLELDAKTDPGTQIIRHRSPFRPIGQFYQSTSKL